MCKKIFFTNLTNAPPLCKQVRLNEWSLQYQDDLT